MAGRSAQDRLQNMGEHRRSLARREDALTDQIHTYNKNLALLEQREEALRERESYIEQREDEIETMRYDLVKQQAAREDRRNGASQDIEDSDKVHEKAKIDAQAFSQKIREAYKDLETVKLEVHLQDC
jgi:chromosome segregation ATPase